MTYRLAILTSHPIQYNAPAFAELAKQPELDVHVFYCWEGPTKTIDPEFGHTVAWDVPLLQGYNYTFVPNVSGDPGTHHFTGLNNPEMITEIQSWRPDVLLVYGWSFLTHLQVMRAFKRKVPVLFRGDSTLLGKRSVPMRFARRAFLRWVFRHVDTALYVGEHNRQYYLEMGLSESQLIWAPHAVDNERFQTAERDDQSRATDWRRKLGITDDDVVFLFAGKLIPRKDPWTLLRAFLQLPQPQRGSRPHMVFVGEGELRQHLEEACRGRSEIHFLGFQNQSAMSTIYRLGDAIVLPSLVDTWGLAVNEAMACGRPAIVSDLVGCGPDLIVQGKTGEVFPHEDERALASVLTRAWKSADELHRMGDDAREFINGWSIPAYVKILTEVATSR